MAVTVPSSLVERLYEEVKGIWEERFERSYGFWRDFVDDIIESFLACEDFEGGFARVVCNDCRSESAVFSAVNNSVTATPDNPEAFERLARYLLHPPLSLERMSFTADQKRIQYRGKRNHGTMTPSDHLDPLDFLARLLMHIPEPRIHITRYFGCYSILSRARRRKASQEQQTADEQATSDNLPSPAERRRL